MQGVGKNPCEEYDAFVGLVNLAFRFQPQMVGHGIDHLPESRCEQAVVAKSQSYEEESVLRRERIAE